jgi:hypothetical protein
MSDETKATTIGPERLALLDQVWEHRKTAARAWAKEMSALHRMIGDPARAEEYERHALAAADEKTEADRQADLLLHELNVRFPPVSIEQPDAGAWGPILALLAGYARDLRRAGEGEPKP